MKKILLFTFFTLFTLAASAQIAQNTSNDFRSSRQSIKVFPNPAMDYIQLQDKDEQVENIFIYNIVGKKMASFQGVEEDKKYHLDIPVGMYLVQLVDDYGKIISTKRLSIRRP